MKRLQGGFTLIELVMVIVIIGILAATALPKFGSLSTDARAAVVRGLYGSMAATNMQIYAKSEISGQTKSSGAISEDVCGGTVKTAYGYALDATELTKCLILNPSTDFSIVDSSVRYVKAPSPDNCKVGYTAATTTSPPTYTVDIQGC